MKYVLSQLSWLNLVSWPNLIDSSVALFSKSLTLPDVYAVILSKFLIALIGFPRLGAAFYTKPAHECT